VELRVYETTGRTAEAVIRTGLRVRAACRTNFLGRPGDDLGPIKVAQDTLRLRIPPWKIATVRLRLAE
jgi:hypothetical protein